MWRIRDAIMVVAATSALSMLNPVAVAESGGGGKVSADFQSAATQTFRNRATGKCLEGTNISYTNTCSGDWEQEWTVHRWADGTRRFQNIYSGKCLTGQDDGWGMGTCDSSTDQSWYVRSFSTGIELRNQRSGKCLDDSTQYGLRTYPCSTSPQAYQLWY